jgi:DNA/RNA-binding domain of Phe-tRNA-synthetase-like protein
MIDFELDHPELRLALVQAEPVQVEPSSAALVAELEALEASLRADPRGFDEAVRGAVRDVLRRGGYKPTGRGKPASEFLLGAALEGRSPRINNLVDLNNLVSLRWALPISMFDADLLGDDVAVRYGRSAEAYVFNSSGQSMEIAGLPLICRGLQREAVGNAVKDSMLCKVHPGTRRACAVVYGAAKLPDDRLVAAAEDLARAFRSYAHAAEVKLRVLPIGVRAG